MILIFFKHLSRSLAIASIITDKLNDTKISLRFKEKNDPKLKVVKTVSTCDIFIFFLNKR